LDLHFEWPVYAHSVRILVAVSKGMPTSVCIGLHVESAERSSAPDARDEGLAHA
jgi:hypothetical protein